MIGRKSLKELEKKWNRCKSCRVDLSEQKRLLHVHHLNGEKSDNSAGNLIVLCADCHRKEPHHGHVHVKLADVKAIGAKY